MNQHQKALQQIKTIAAHNNLTAADINKALEIASKDNQENNIVGISEVLGYLGGVLVFAGIGIYTSVFWQDLSSSMRIVLTLGAGLSCYSLAFFLSTDLRYSKISQVLFVIATILEPLGLYVFLHEVFGKSGNLHFAILFVSGIMLVQHLLTFWETRSNLVLFMSLLFGLIFSFTLFDYMELKRAYIFTSLGTALFFIVFSLKQTSYQSLSGFWYLLAGISFLNGAYDLLYNTPFEVFFLGLCVFVIYLSTIVRSKSILLVGTIGMLGYIGHYTMLQFLNSLGWPISLMICGACFLLLSVFAIKIKERYIKNS